VKADLLLVDEVLSVGDMAFQQKSLAKMNQLRDSGATIVFVSHNLSAIKTFCSRVILLDAGNLLADGNPDKVINAYKSWEQEKARQAGLTHADGKAMSLDDGNQERNIPGDQSIKVELLNSEGNPSHEYHGTDRIRVLCRFNAATRIPHPVYQIQVRRRADGFVCFTRYYISDPSVPDLLGEGLFEAEIQQLLLVPGEYTLEASLVSYDYPTEIITSLPETFLVVGRIRSSEAGVYEPVVDWIQLPDSNKEIVQLG
jgi:lipopolysaccharide transport system ATP-binding protein